MSVGFLLVANAIVGTGNRLATEIGAIIERTINWIEQDMGRKPGSPAAQTPIKQQSPSYQQGAKSKQTHNALVPGGAATTNSEQCNNSGTTNGNYYDSSVATPATTYPPLSYGDQAAGGVAVSQSSNGAVGSTDGAQYLYAAASAAAAATASSATAAMEQAAAAQNPLIAFASQATQHVAGQAADNWPTQAPMMTHNAAPTNTWQDWTNAIQDTQDRYSANALLTLNSGRPGEVGAGGVVDHVNQGDAMASGHTGQWPLLLFHDGSGGVSGP